MKKYVEHQKIEPGNFKLVDATTLNGNDLIWIETSQCGTGQGGAWFTPEAALEFSKSLSQIIEGHRARTSNVPDMVTEAIGGRDLMITSVPVLERLRDDNPGRIGDYIDGVISARISLQTAGVESV